MTPVHRLVKIRRKRYKLRNLDKKGELFAVTSHPSPEHEFLVWRKRTDGKHVTARPGRKQGSEIVEYGGLHAQSPLDNHDVWHLFVEPEYWGMGIGSTAKRFLAMIDKAAGRETIALPSWEVSINDERREAFFRNHFEKDEASLLITGKAMRAPVNHVIESGRSLRTYWLHPSARSEPSRKPSHTSTHRTASAAASA
jgi:GNAT superfamily N-acetyltransferase